MPHRFIAALFLALVLLPVSVLAGEETPSVDGGHYYQLYFFKPAVGRDFISVEQITVRNAKFYVPADWAIRALDLQYNIAGTNRLLVSQKPVDASSVPHLPAASPMSIAIEGRDFTGFIPSETGNPLQALVELDAFAQATGNGYSFSDKTQVIHLRQGGADGQGAKPSTCETWVSGIAEEQAKKESPGGWWNRLKPLCNDSAEMTSAATGRAIAFYGPPCQGGAMHVITDAERRQWKDEADDLATRYDVVDERNCPMNIP